MRVRIWCGYTVPTGGGAGGDGAADGDGHDGDDEGEGGDRDAIGVVRDGGGGNDGLTWTDWVPGDV